METSPPLIPVGFCGLQDLIPLAESESCQFDLVAESIVGTIAKYKALFKCTPDVCFVRLKSPELCARLPEIKIPGIEIVPVERQMRTSHIWVGSRSL